MTDGSRDVRRPAQDIALPVYQGRYDVLSGCGFRAFGGNEGHGRGFATLRVGRPCETKCEIAGTLAQSFALVVILTLIFGAVLAPIAFADALVYDDGGRVWGPNIVNSSTPNQPLYGQIIVANNKYNAALFALGYDPNDNDKFTDEVKAKLSNESTGGAFYTFASRIFPVRTFGDIPWQTSNIDFIGLYGTIATLYDVDRIFAVDYDSVLQLAAKVSLEAVLNGGGTSGGGSGGEVTVPDTITSVASATYGSPSQSNTQFQPTRSTLSGNARYITDVLRGDNVAYPYTAVFWLYVIRSGSWDAALVVLKCKSLPNSVTSASDTSIGSVDLRVTGTGGYKAYFWRYGDLTYEYVNDSSIRKSVGLNVTAGKRSAYDSTMSDNDVFRLGQSAPNTPFGISGVYTAAYNLNCLSVTPVIPDTNWPEPDDPLPEPDPPEVPDVPDEQPITQPNPTNPTVPTQPTDPVGGTPPQYDPISLTTEPTYQTPDLSAVLDAMNQHCIHLQNAIHTMGDDLGTYLGTIITQQVSRLHDMVYDNLGWIGGLITSEGQSLRTSIYGNIGWLGDTMVDEFGALKDYLQQLFTWLGEQLNYEVNVSQDSYDDSSVLYWLKRIWSKMGDGISTRPVDPVVDPIGVGDWLGTLWDNLLTALRDLGVTLLDDVGDGLQGLVSKFPFSVPWDIAALLALLAADPVTPEFSIPCYALSGSQIVQVGSYVIDLDYLDAVMGGVRLMEKIGFVFLLMYRTKDFMELLEGVVGFD